MPDEIKQERWNALMARQQKISARRLKRKVGTRQQIIIDEVGPTVAKGRSKADAPQIDGAVYLSSRRPLKVGEIVTGEDRARRSIRPARQRRGVLNQTTPLDTGLPSRLYGPAP